MLGRSEHRGGARLLAGIRERVGQRAGLSECHNIVGAHPGCNPFGVDEAVSNQSGQAKPRHHQCQPDHAGGHQRGSGSNRAGLRQPHHGVTS